MCVLKGFPTVLAKAKPPAVINYPFGIWFANDTTLYVADEGSGAAGTTDADFYAPATPAQNPTAGLQKWIFNSSAGEWQLAYILTSGLDLGVPYNVPGYPTGDNSGPGGSDLPWAPATDGLRNITGSRELGRDRDHLRDHLHHQRERRPGRRSEQAGRDHGSTERHHSSGKGELLHADHRWVRRGPAGRRLHAREQVSRDTNIAIGSISLAAVRGLSVRKLVGKLFEALALLGVRICTMRFLPVARTSSICASRSRDTSRNRPEWFSDVRIVRCKVQLASSADRRRTRPCPRASKPRCDAIAHASLPAC